MKVIDRLVIRLFFYGEVLLFCVMYIVGAQGLRVVWRQRAENKIVAEQNSTFELEVAALKRQIAQWQDEPFYKEKVAREQLQMARAGDTIYYL